MPDFVVAKAGKVQDALAKNGEPGGYPAVDEQSFGAEPIDVLLSDLDNTEEEWADSAALFGAGGLFDAQRKAKLCTVAMEIRDMLFKQGGKATESLIDQMAHADKQYIEWLDDMQLRRAQWLAMDAHRDGLVLRINRGQAMLRVAARFAQ